MKNCMLLCNTYYKIFFFLILQTILFSSCVTQQNIEYIQYKEKGPVSFDEAYGEDYRLKPNDELYIQISSLDDVSSNIFSGTNAQQSIQMGSMQPYGASLVSYAIDKDGYLVLPVIGNLLVTGKTLAKVSEMIKESLTNVLNQPIVSVKLVNRYVSVIGEVSNPGHYTYAQDKITIFDVISLAGDVTDYGNRKEIILTRNENGKNIRITIDLTKTEILASNYYYIRPNDIVYVKPLKKKFWALRQFPYSVLLSTITTALLIYNVIE